MFAEDRYKLSLVGVSVLFDKGDFGDRMMDFLPPLKQMRIFAEFSQAHMVVSEQMPLIILYNRKQVLIGML